MTGRGTLAWAIAALVLAGCNQPEKRLNAPPHGQPHETTDMQGTFVYMSDNALLADMNVSDMHFMPHRARLSGSGERHLARLAMLMHEYGGTLRFSTSLTDKQLIQDRIATVRDFLNAAGVDTTTQWMTEDMVGGEGMDATEAILIKTHEGTYDPDKQQSTDESDTFTTD